MTEPIETTTTQEQANPRVLLVDDHDLFRTGLRNLLEEQGVQISGEAASGSEAVRSVRILYGDLPRWGWILPEHYEGLMARRRARQEKIDRQWAPRAAKAGE